MLTPEEQFELQRVKNEFSKCKVKPEYEVQELQEVMLPMDDGVKLRTLIYRPVRDGIVPAVVVRTCYPNNDYLYSATAKEYCKRGFAYIYQYCRGTGGSEGEWEPNVNERADGKKTIDWICDQEWVGNTGYCGCSYLSLTGWLIADILPEKVKTMYLTHYGAHRFVSAFKDGLFRHDVLTAWTMENAGYPITADYLESCKYRPQIEVDEKLWGKKIEWYRKWITSTNKDDEYWNMGFWNLLKEIPSRVKVPLYVGEGWYDHHLASALETWKSLSDECKEKSRLLIGAWEHGFNVKLEDRAGKHYENDDILRAFDWLYSFLVEEKAPKAEIDYYIIGDDSWYSREKFEIEDQKEVKFYLTKKGEKEYALTEQNPAESGSLTWVYDPADPVMTHGAESLLVTKQEQGSLRQPKPNYRKDVISCISEPLQENMTIVGQIKACFTVSTDVDDTAFAAKIMEVMEDGKAYNMRTGITTLGYRNGGTRRVTYQPGEKVQIVIDTWDLAWKVQKGSRIRIDITSSDFPQYSIHSNYAGCWAEQKEIRTANQTVYFGGDDESYISFPVLS